MSRWMKKMLVVGTWLLAAGVILTGIGLGTGGKLSYAVNLEEGKAYVLDRQNYIEKDMEVETFDTLLVNVDAVDVQIKQGSDYRVSYYAGEWEEPLVEVKDKTLSITKDSKNQHYISFWDFQVDISGKKSEKIVITVPADADLKSLTVTDDYGRVSMADLNVETYKIDSKSGDVTIENVLFEKGAVNADYGSVDMRELKGSECSMTMESGDAGLKDVELKTLTVMLKYGDAELTNVHADAVDFTDESGSIKFAEITGNSINVHAKYGNVDLVKANVNIVDIQCESGDVDAALIGKQEDYDVDVYVNTGDFKVNGRKQMGRVMLQNNSKKKVAVVSEYGDVDLNFSEQ